ncbi:MAG: sugar phosphate nucleotidyltransferase [archaeon]
MRQSSRFLPDIAYRCVSEVEGSGYYVTKSNPQDPEFKQVLDEIIGGEYDNHRLTREDPLGIRLNHETAALVYALYGLAQEVSENNETVTSSVTYFVIRHMDFQPQRFTLRDRLWLRLQNYMPSELVVLALTTDIYARRSCADVFICQVSPCLQLILECRIPVLCQAVAFLNQAFIYHNMSLLSQIMYWRNLRVSIDKRVLAFILAGGKGTRLGVLTRDRTKPAVPILGHLRLFDIIAANLNNSEIAVWIIATQFSPFSLTNYVLNHPGWEFDGRKRRIELSYPHQLLDDTITSFGGTADCIRKSWDRIEKYNPDTVLVLAADHMYSMDYNAVLEHHATLGGTGATVMVNPVTESRVSGFGIAKVNDSGEIVDFVEKPASLEELAGFEISDSVRERYKIDDPELKYLASMGNYVFDTLPLKRYLEAGGNDFGKHIIPKIPDFGGPLHAFVYTGYWRDIGRIPEYYSSSLEIAASPDIINLSQICTPYDVLNAAYVQNPDLSSLYSPGSFVYGTCISSVIGPRIIVGDGSDVAKSILLGGNVPTPFESLPENHVRDSYLRGVISDKNVNYQDCQIDPNGKEPEEIVESLRIAGLMPYIDMPNGIPQGHFSLDSGILVFGRSRTNTPLTLKGIRI